MNYKNRSRYLQIDCLKTLIQAVSAGVLETTHVDANGNIIVSNRDPKTGKFISKKTGEKPLRPEEKTDEGLAKATKTQLLYELQEIKKENQAREQSLSSQLTKSQQEINQSKIKPTVNNCVTEALISFEKGWNDLYDSYVNSDAVNTKLLNSQTRKGLLGNIQTTSEALVLWGMEKIADRQVGDYFKENEISNKEAEVTELEKEAIPVGKFLDQESQKARKRQEEREAMTPQQESERLSQLAGYNRTIDDVKQTYQKGYDAAVVGLHDLGVKWAKMMGANIGDATTASLEKYLTDEKNKKAEELDLTKLRYEIDKEIAKRNEAVIKSLTDQEFVKHGFPNELTFGTRQPIKMVNTPKPPSPPPSEKPKPFPLFLREPRPVGKRYKRQTFKTTDTEVKTLSELPPVTPEKIEWARQSKNQVTLIKNISSNYTGVKSP